jgi:hypothetical protein
VPKQCSLPFLPSKNSCAFSVDAADPRVKDAAGSGFTLMPHCSAVKTYQICEQRASLTLKVVLTVDRHLVPFSPSLFLKFPLAFGKT